MIAILTTLMTALPSNFIGQVQANTIEGTDGDDDITGTSEDDNINSEDGDDRNIGDTIIGEGSGDDTIKSGKGNDINYGDTLRGIGLGDDTINTGQGDDQITGNGGADKFKCGRRTDEVTDYNPGEGDKATGNCENIDKSVEKKKKK